MTLTTPVTQRDVAQACGLHHSTVCLALKNSPTLAPETRERIQQAARQLGYQPNVSAYNLACLKKERAPNASLPLAWINQEPAEDFWRVHPQARIAFAAVRRRAAEFGYHLDEFWARQPRMSVARLTQILRARGIQGVIFPIHRSSGLSLTHPAWSQFSSVALNDHRLARWLDIVSPDYYHNLDLVLAQPECQAPARVGLVLDREFDALTNGLVRSRYLRYQDDLAPDHRLPVCLLSGLGFADAQVLAAWQAAYRPDVVIGRDRDCAAALPALQGATFIPLQGGEADAGIDEGIEAVAAAGIDVVTRKIQRFDTGIGGSTQVHLIRGLWRDAAAARASVETAVPLPSLAA